MNFYSLKPEHPQSLLDYLAGQKFLRPGVPGGGVLHLTPAYGTYERWRDTWGLAARHDASLPVPCQILWSKFLGECRDSILAESDIWPNPPRVIDDIEHNLIIDRNLRQWNEKVSPERRVSENPGVRDRLIHLFNNWQATLAEPADWEDVFTGSVFGDNIPEKEDQGPSTGTIGAVPDPKYRDFLAEHEKYLRKENLASEALFWKQAIKEHKIIDQDFFERYTLAGGRTPLAGGTLVLDSFLGFSHTDLFLLWHLVPCFTHIVSTGIGGAALNDFLSNREIPGLDSMKKMVGRTAALIDNAYTAVVNEISPPVKNRSEPARVQIRPAIDREMEIRQILTTIVDMEKQAGRGTKEAPADFSRYAIYLPGIEHYFSFIERIFADFDVPARIYHPRPMTSYPAYGVIHHLSEISQGGFQFDFLRSLIRGPFLSIKACNQYLKENRDILLEKLAATRKDLGDSLGEEFTSLAEELSQEIEQGKIHFSWEAFVNLRRFLPGQDISRPLSAEHLGAIWKILINMENMALTPDRKRSGLAQCLYLDLLLEQMSFLREKHTPVDLVNRLRNWLGRFTPELVPPAEKQKTGRYATLFAERRTREMPPKLINAFLGLLNSHARDREQIQAGETCYFHDLLQSFPGEMPSFIGHPPRRNAVYVDDGLSVYGANFEVVFIAGLTLEDFPRPRERRFLTREMEKLTTLNPTAESRALFTHFARLALEAGCLYLSYPENDFSGPLEPSTLFAEAGWTGDLIKTHALESPDTGVANESPNSPEAEQNYDRRSRARTGLESARASGDLTKLLPANDGLWPRRLALLARRLWGQSNKESAVYDGILNPDPAWTQWMDRRIEERTYSASRLQELIECPQRYLWGRVMNLRPLDEVRDELSEASRGTLLHKIIENTLEYSFENPAMFQDPPTNTDADHWQFKQSDKETKAALVAEQDLLRRRWVLKILQKIHGPVILKTLREIGFLPEPGTDKDTAGLNAQTRKLLADIYSPLISKNPDEARLSLEEYPSGSLINWLEKEFHWQHVFQPVASEAIFEIPWAGLRVVGAIDRVDKLRDGPGVAVTDIKTGKSGIYKGKDLLQLKSVQMTIYLEAVRQALGGNKKGQKDILPNLESGTSLPLVWGGFHALRETDRSGFFPVALVYDGDQADSRAALEHPFWNNHATTFGVRATYTKTGAISKYSREGALYGEVIEEGLFTEAKTAPALITEGSNFEEDWPDWRESFPLVPKLLLSKLKDGNFHHFPDGASAILQANNLNSSAPCRFCDYKWTCHAGHMDPRPQPEKKWQEFVTVWTGGKPEKHKEPLTWKGNPVEVAAAWEKSETQKGPELNDRQKEALAIDKSIVVTAGAGAGKTEVLARRYALMILEGAHPREILVLTFTNKAAQEMKGRIFRTLADIIHVYQPLLENKPAGAIAKSPGFFPEKLTKEQLKLFENARRDFQQNQISTIDSFCIALLREFPEPQQVDPAFQVGDSQDWQMERSFKTRVDEYFRTHLREPAHPLYQLVSRLGLGPIRTALQQLYHDGRALAWARMAREPESYQHQLLGDLLAPDTDKGESPDLRFLLDILPAWREKVAGGNPSETMMSALEDLASREGDRRQLAEWVRQEFEDSGYFEYAGWLAACFEEIMEGSRGKSLLTFDQVKSLAVSTLEDPVVGRQMRVRFRYIMADEFQDTDPRQWELIRALTGDLDPDLARVFIVGDPKQAIYGFRGADPQIFRRAGAALEAKRKQDYTAITFEKNYRSAHPVIHFNNRLFGDLFRYREEYQTGLEYEAAEPGREGGPEKEPGHVEILFHPKDVKKEAPDLLAGVLERIYRDGNLEPGAQIAVLFRTRTKMGALARRLEARGLPVENHAGEALFRDQITRDLLSLLRYLLEPDRDLSFVGLARSVFFAVSDEAIIDAWLEQRKHRRVPGRKQKSAGEKSEKISFADRVFAKLGAAGVIGKRLLRDLRSDARQLPPFELLERFLHRTGYELAFHQWQGPEQARANWGRYIQVLHEIAGASNARQTVTLEELEERLLDQLRKGEESRAAVPETIYQGDNQSKFHLMTIHASKGLEFDTVLIPCEDFTGGGHFSTLDIWEDHKGAPHFFFKGLSGATREAAGLKNLAKLVFEPWTKLRQNEEELRLFYVAATRARRQLYLWSQEPGQPKKNKAEKIPLEHYLGRRDNRDYLGWFAEQNPDLLAGDGRFRWQDEQGREWSAHARVCQPEEELVAKSEHPEGEAETTSAGDQVPVAAWAAGESWPANQELLAEDNRRRKLDTPRGALKWHRDFGRRGHAWPVAAHSLEPWFLEPSNTKSSAQVKPWWARFQKDSSSARILEKEPEFLPLNNDLLLANDNQWAAYSEIFQEAPSNLFDFASAGTLLHACLTRVIQASHREEKWSEPDWPRLLDQQIPGFSESPAGREWARFLATQLQNYLASQTLIEAGQASGCLWEFPVHGRPAGEKPAEDYFIIGTVDALYRREASSPWVVADWKTSLPPEKVLTGEEDGLKHWLLDRIGGNNENPNSGADSQNRGYWYQLALYGWALEKNGVPPGEFRLVFSGIGELIWR